MYMDTNTDHFTSCSHMHVRDNNNNTDICVIIDYLGGGGGGGGGTRMKPCRTMLAGNIILEGFTGAAIKRNQSEY